MTEVDTEELEERLAALARDGGLSGEAETRYRRLRGRVSSRHRQWRDGVPALDMLFDEDAHRAKALAGNLVTEYEETVQAWLRCSGEPGDPDHVWIREYRREWREISVRYGNSRDWEDDEAYEVFEGFLGELRDRAHVRIVAGAPAREIGRGPGPGPIGRLARRVALAVRRLFLPGAPT